MGDGLGDGRGGVWARGFGAVVEGPCRADRWTPWVALAFASHYEIVVCLSDWVVEAGFGDLAEVLVLGLFRAILIAGRDWFVLVLP